MIAVLSWLIGSKAGRITALCLLTAASVLAMALSLYRKGGEAEKAKQVRASLDALRNRISIDDEIARMSPDARRAELARWMRGGD